MLEHSQKLGEVPTLPGTLQKKFPLWIADTVMIVQEELRVAMIVGRKLY